MAIAPIGNSWYKSEMTKSVPNWQIDPSEPPEPIIIGTAMHGEQALSEQYYSHFWVLLFFTYHGEVVVDEHSLAVEPGSIGIFPPASLLTIRYQGLSQHHYAHLALPAGRGGRVRPIPAHVQLGHEAMVVEDEFRQAIATFATDRQRCGMILWRLLLRIIELGNLTTPAQQARHPALIQAMELIELGMGDSLRVSWLAQRCAISARQLGNIFRSEQGCSPNAYIRQRRMARAQLLLTRTSTPISAIARDVGIPDLQAFNKAIHRHFSMSPRELRSLSG